MIEILNLLYLWCWFSGFIYFSVQFYECMYSIIRVPDGANCLRCQKKTTSRLFNLHPSQASPSPPPPLACKRNIFRPHVACKRNIFRPHVPCSPPSDSFKESISSSANLLKVKNSRKFVLLKLCHYWRRCFLIPDKPYLQITAK